MEKTDPKTKLVSFALVVLMLGFIFAGTVSADVKGANESIFSDNTCCASSQSSTSDPPPVVEVIYEEPVFPNPFGHSAIRVGDKVYDVSKEGEGSGNVNIRERDWNDVLNDDRGQETARVPLTEEQANQFKENLENEVGNEFDYNFVTNNCADWVEDQLRDVGVDIPDNLIQFPKDTLEQVENLPDDDGDEGTNPWTDPGGDKPDDTYDVSDGASLGDGGYSDGVIFGTSRMVILKKGHFQTTYSLLNKGLKEPSIRKDIKNFSVSLLNKYPTVIIPTGGLYGLDSSPTFKSDLEQYVKNGGTLIVFSQQHGYEYSALPGGNLSGFGWIEDQSCHHHSVYIDTYHPVLSGQDSVTLDVVVDGYFTKWPENATILLSRTKNGMPAMLMYEYGKGRVIASTLYTDWAYGHYQATKDGERLVMDLITWAKDQKNITEYVPKDAVNIHINITNYGNINTDKIFLEIVDPDKNLADFVNISISILPNETKSINFTMPTKLGIWYVNYFLSDLNGGVQYGVERFAVSKYAENPEGFVYHGKDITFTISSPEEQYAYGSDVPFTIHVWNKGDTDRDILVKTYYQDWSLRSVPLEKVNETLTVPAGGEATYTHTVNVGDIRLSHNQLIIRAEFYEDGSSLGRTEKVVYMFSPSVSVHVETDQKEYAKGEDVSVLLNLTNKRSAACNATVTVKTLDPGNNKVFEDTFNANLSAYESLTKTLNFALPPTAEYGAYIVIAEAYSNGDKIGSGSTYFEVLKDYIVKVNFDKPDKAYKVRENMNIDLEVTNIGSALWSSTVNISIPDLAYEDLKYVSLNPNETETFSYNLNIPGTTTAGKHDVIIAISFDSAVKKYYFVIPESNLILSSEKTSYDAGEYLYFNLTNIGGVDTTCNCSIEFYDSHRFKVYKNNTQENIPVGATKTITFQIPEQAVSGNYYLMVECEDLTTDKTTCLSKSYTVSGLQASLVTSTDKEVYRKGENIRAFANITNLNGLIDDATLNLKVYSSRYLIAPNVSFNYNNLPGRLEINNTFIDAVTYSTGEATFTVGTTGGDPENPYDDYKDLIYGHPNPGTSFTTIRIDGIDYIYGSPDGTFVSLPHFEGSSIVSDWEIEDVVITQKLTIIYSSTGNPDALEIKYSIVNDGGASKDVGVRVMIDTQLAGNDGAPFTIPDVGDVTNEMDFVGADIPIYWTTMDSLTSPTVIAHGTLRGVGFDPDRFVIAQWPGIHSTTWDYEVDPNQWITSDSAIGIWWNPISLSSGQSREVATFYGIGYVSEAGGEIIWENSTSLDITDKKDISTDLSLNATKKLQLVATLYSNSSQIIDQNMSYFYITETNTSMTLETDKTVYKPNEKVVIYGAVRNLGNATKEYNLSIKANEEEIFSDSFSLNPDQSHPFTTSTRQNNSFVLEGTVDGITITDFIKIEYPSINVDIIAPDVVGLADFDVGILIENIGNIVVDLDVSINSTWNVTIPEGESRLLETTMSIARNTTLNVTISGDVNRTIQKEIIFGENAKINVTPQNSYFEGLVEIPLTVENMGILDTEFDATFSVDEQSIVKTFFVPKGQTINDTLSFNLTKGTYTLRYTSPFEEGNISFNVAMPKFAVTSVPANMTFNLGENVTMTFRVKNVGTAEDRASMRLEVLGIFEDVNFTWIKPGEEANISFDFIMPDDLEEKSYKASYEVDGEKGKFSFFVHGANITVDASLDKTLYEENETAVLTLNVENNRNMNLSLFSRVKFNEYDNMTHFNLTDLEPKTLTFNVPVKFGGDNKMLYTVYTDSGRALYINSIYVYEKKPGVPIRIYTDKDVYNMGEDVTIHIIDVTRTDLLNLTAPNFTYNGTVSSPTTLDFTLPELRSGTYYIEYTFGNFSSAHPFDVVGYSSRVIEADLGKEKYYSGEALRLGINIEANRDISGLLRTWIYNPEDELIDEFEVNETLTEGENEIGISRTLSTNMSGIHVIVYGFYADLSGHSLTLLASGAEYFDAEGVGDITPPTITFVPPTPANNSEVAVDYVFVNVTLDETGSVALLNGDGTNYTMSGSGMNFYKNMTSLSNGNHTYKVYVNDTNGNMGKSETRTVKVNVPAPTPTPTPTPPVGGGGGAHPKVTPTATPVATPTPTPTPEITPIVTSIPTPTSTPTPTPIPTPTPTPKPWWKIPGFEAVFAILGLLAVAYLLRRRRE